MLALALAMDQSAYDWHHIGMYTYKVLRYCNFSPIVFVAVMGNGMDVSLPFLVLLDAQRDSKMGVESIKRRN